MADPVVGVVMGSDSDWEMMQHAARRLEEFGVPYESRVVSAHRTPDLLFRYAEEAAGRGLRCIIAGAGGAAHLPGMLAAKTTLPVLGVPVPSKHLQGLDSLLSIVQMPAGVPVATFAIGAAGAQNAALCAAAVLALNDPELAQRLDKLRREQTRRVLDLQLPGSARDPARRHGRRPRRGAARAGCSPSRPAPWATASSCSIPIPGSPAGQVADGHLQAAYTDARRARRPRRRAAPPSPPSSRTSPPRRSSGWRAPAGCVRRSRRSRSRRTASPRRRSSSDAGFRTARSAPVRTEAELRGRASRRSACPRCSRPAAWATTARARRRSSAAEEAPQAFARFGRVACVLEERLALETRVIRGLGQGGRRGGRRLSGRARTATATASWRPRWCRRACPGRIADEARGYGVAGWPRRWTTSASSGSSCSWPTAAASTSTRSPRGRTTAGTTRSMRAPRTSSSSSSARSAACRWRSRRCFSPVAMVNLLGDLWSGGAPRWDEALRRPGVRLHLYGKAEPRPGRKMGHLNCLADDPDRALALALEVRDALVVPPTRKE